MPAYHKMPADSATRAKIRVLIVDDSALARDLLRSFLQSDSEIEVVGEAKNGAEAVRLCGELKPNIVTMDLEMPVMGGIEAITEIMATRAVPILVVSSVADAQQACVAVANGALDVVAKPECDANSAAEFIAKVKLLSGVAVITHIRSRYAKTAEPAGATITPMPLAARSIPSPARLIVIASSTGGTKALAFILQKLPADFRWPILVAQHIADGFADGMAKWLSGISPLPVRLAQEGEAITPGTVYISPSEANLAVTAQHRLTLLPRLPGEIYHPTCDVLFESAAKIYGRRVMGIILTGMGRDGANGLLKIRQAGGNTLAQDEASSIIFGMNKVAIDLGGAASVLPLDEIPQAMCRLTCLPEAGN
jgi:two-component system chemotaxis response regulator CheB